MSEETKRTKQKTRQASLNLKLWLKVGIMLFIFLVGVISGISLGIKTGQMMLFEGMAVALHDSNVNITIDLNETEIIKGINETIVPALRKVIEDG